MVESIKIFFADNGVVVYRLGIRSWSCVFSNGTVYRQRIYDVAVLSYLRRFADDDVFSSRHAQRRQGAFEKRPQRAVSISHVRRVCVFNPYACRIIRWNVFR